MAPSHIISFMACIPLTEVADKYVSKWCIFTSTSYSKGSTENLQPVSFPELAIGKFSAEPRHKSDVDRTLHRVPGTLSQRHIFLRENNIRHSND